MITLELQLYSIRHIMQHTGELMERLADLTAGLPPAQLLAPPEPGEWTARDVGECTHSAHLRACADM